MAAAFFPEFADALFAAVAPAHVARIAFAIPVTVADAAVPRAVPRIAAPDVLARAARGLRSGR